VCIINVITERCFINHSVAAIGTDGGGAAPLLFPDLLLLNFFFVHVSDVRESMVAQPFLYQLREGM
jgi:hypothetical protein